MKYKRIKYKVGDKIRMRMNSPHSLHGHHDAIGEIVGLRSCMRRWAGGNTTHYMIKWDCYKIPHAYTTWEVDAHCEICEEL